ncbi:MAG TPA: carbonic anhydrase [Burkholderiales bacterium]|nr:carbonic anhydrase [Burkholderiales bacterium]
MPDELLKRLQRFEKRYFPQYKREFRALAREGQHPTTLFIGCSDSRLVPHLLTNSGPGELFVVRNVGNFVPPFDASHGYHGTCAAIEFAVLNLNVRDIVVCAHSHCGAIRALYTDLHPEAVHMREWLELGRDAALPVLASEEALRKTEQRSLVIQLERLMNYPMVASRVQGGQIFLHGWHYVIEEGRVDVLDVASGRFRPVDEARESPRVEYFDLLQ